MLKAEKLDLDRLRAFLLVAKHGGLRHAAGHMSQSIPAISAKLQKLESEIGMRLFERLPNKLVLTFAGERLLHQVEEIFAKIEEVLGNVEGSTASEKIVVSVGSDHAWFFAPKVLKFLKDYPDAALTMRVYKSAEALIALDNGEIDIGFGLFPPLPRRFQRTVVAETSLSLAFNAKDPAWKRGPPQPADLASRRVIVPPYSTFMRLLKDKRIAPIINSASSIVEAPTCETAAEFAEMGVGVALIHTVCATRQRRKSLKMIDLGNRASKLHLCAVCRPGALRRSLVRSLFDRVLG